MSLEEMIALLRERNMVADMDYQGLVALFGQENIDKIVPEDLEITYQIKNIGNLTFNELVDEIQRVKDATNYKDPATFSDIFSLKDAENNLNTLGELNDQLDKIQSAYKNLSDAMDTYAETGYITIDQFQAIVEQGSQFLDYLELEDGQLDLNEQAMYNLAEARIVEMKAQMIQGVVENVSRIESETDAANYLTTTNYELAESYNVLAEAKIRDWAANSALSQESKDAVVNKAMGDIDKINALVAKMDLGSIGGKASSTAKSAISSFTDALDKELTALDKKMEAGYIDFNDYIQARLALIEDYYRQGKISADEYYSYLNKHYDTQLSYMDKVVNAVKRRIDSEIDGLEKQKDNINDYYQLQIDSLEKEKTLLEEANKERQRQIDLQKALYEMERARNQRTTLQYSEEKGMHYVVDDSTIREAEDNVADAQYQIQISEIEKSISKLEEARDRETDAIQEMIDRLQDYKDACNDITSAYAEQQEDLIAAQILGSEWESDILNGRLDTLNAFKDEYIRIQQAMVDAANQAAQAIANPPQNATISDTSGSKHVDLKSSNTSNDTTATLPKTSGGGSGLHGLGGNIRRNLVQTHFYASGTDNAKKGLNLVGEEGDEVYFDNHDHVGIVTEPTLIPMEGGEVVKNPKDSKKLLDPGNIQSVDNIGIINGEVPEGKYVTYSSGVRQYEDGTIIKPDGTVLTPLQPGDPIFDMRQKFYDYAAKNGGDISSIMAPINSMQRDMERMANAINTINNINNNNSRMQQVINQQITLNCPNVTNNSGIEYIQKELGHLSQRAEQEAMKH